MAQEATIENFDEMIQGPLTVVDFWAPWCGPCKMMEPIMAELEKEFAGQIKFVKFNVDHQQAIAERYKVMSVPARAFSRWRGQGKSNGYLSKRSAGTLFRA